MQPAGASAGAAAAMAAVGLSADLQKRVKIMAEHVARNGPDFEATVKAKNAGNPQFGFLTNGEGSEYYQQLLQAHRAAQLQPAASQVAAGAVGGEGGAELADLVARWREPQVVQLWPEGDRQLSEVVASLEQIASRDAIRAGRTWIEANVAAAHGIAGNLMKRIVYLPTCAHRLHILFLLHDVLQTEVSKMEPLRPLVAAFKPFLVWMLRPSYQLAQSVAPDGEDSTKILKLLALWAERGILNAREAEEVRWIVTAKELPPPSAPPPAAGQVQHQAPTLMQQAAAQLSAQQAAAARAPMPPQGQPASVLGILQQMPPRPPGAIVPMPGFSGVIRPAMQQQAVATLPQQAGQTPETVPVGVMATMLKQVSKRGKDLHTAFVPYKPLEPMYTPQTLPPVAPPTARLMERLAEYYDIVGGDAGRDEKMLALGPPPVAQASGVAIAPPAPQPAAGAGDSAAPSEPLAADDTASERAAGAEDQGAGGERKVRRTMCASGSRSRSRSRSASNGRSRAAAAAMAGVAVPPPPEGPAPVATSPKAELAAASEAPRKAVQAID